MPSFSDSVPSGKASQAMARTTSSQSVTKGSPSASAMIKTKQHKAHTVGHGRRNPSYGKNLHKLTKIVNTEGDVPDQASKGKQHTQSDGPSNAHHVKRNSSTISLPRAESKVSIKNNTSRVSLKRNSSSNHVNRSRPTTPVRKNSSYAQLDRLKRKAPAQFTVDAGDDADEEEDQDDGWTEESNSPAITRSNSISKSTRPQVANPYTQAAPMQQKAHLPNSPPESPVADNHLDSNTKTNGHFSSTQQNRGRRHQPGYPDADAITSRLLSGQAAPRLAPEISSISVNGIPGTHTPPLQYGQEPARTPYTPSMPSSGISRFLNAPASSSASTGPGFLSNHASAHLDAPSPGLARASTTLSAYSSRAPSPNPEQQSDAIRRAKSASNLGRHPRTPTVIRDAPESYTFRPPPRTGGNTQAKLNLWRDSERVELHHGLPPALRDRLPTGMLNPAEKKTRQWEDADAELGYLKRFRNPVVEAARRVIRRSGKSKEKAKRKSESERGLAIRAAVNGAIGQGSGSGHVGSLVDGTAEGASGGSRRTVDSDTYGSLGARSQSRGGPRNVRFDIGDEDDSHSGRGREGEQEEDGDAESLEELLRRMWKGEEEQFVEG